MVTQHKVSKSNNCSHCKLLRMQQRIDGILNGNVPSVVYSAGKEQTLAYKDAIFHLRVVRQYRRPVRSVLKKTQSALKHYNKAISSNWLGERAVKSKTAATYSLFGES